MIHLAAFALVVSGFFQTLSVYGGWYLLAYLPMVVLWGYFLGLPPIIGMCKVCDTFTSKEFAGTFLAQVALVILLVVLVNALGITQLLITFAGIGVLNGIAMPAPALRSERKDSTISKK
jgi:hypothetical protein